MGFDAEVERLGGLRVAHRVALEAAGDGLLELMVDEGAGPTAATAPRAAAAPIVIDPAVAPGERPRRAPHAGEGAAPVSGASRRAALGMRAFTDRIPK